MAAGVERRNILNNRYTNEQFLLKRAPQRIYRRNLMILRMLGLLLPMHPERAHTHKGVGS